MNKVQIWTDGACSNNGKPNACCGAGIFLRCGSAEKKLSIPLPQYKTNNQAELYAAVHALSLLKFPCTVDLTTDSKYVKRGITEWIKKWKKNNWVTSDKKPVKNQDLWMELDRLYQLHDVAFHWVKGHADSVENQLVDELAVAARLTLKKG